MKKILTFVVLLVLIGTTYIFSTFQFQIPPPNENSHESILFSQCSVAEKIDNTYPGPVFPPSRNLFRYHEPEPSSPIKNQHFPRVPPREVLHSLTPPRVEPPEEPPAKFLGIIQNESQKFAVIARGTKTFILKKGDSFENLRLASIKHDSICFAIQQNLKCYHMGESIYVGIKPYPSAQ